MQGKSRLTSRFILDSEGVDWEDIYNSLECAKSEKIYIVHKNLSRERADKVTGALLKNKYLRELVLQSKDDDTCYASISILLRVLSNPCIRRFNVHEETDSYDMVDLLKCHPHVRLSHHTLRPRMEDTAVYPELFSRCDRITVICDLVRDISYLPRLDTIYSLEMCSIPSDLDRFEEFLNGMINLKSMRMSLISRDPDPPTDISKIVSSIKNHPKLEKIALSFDEIEIGEIIRSRNFRTIELGSVLLTPESISAICENQKLEHLLICSSEPPQLNTLLLKSLISCPLRSLKLSGRLPNDAWEYLSILERQGLVELNVHCDGSEESYHFLSSLTLLKKIYIISHVEHIDKIYEVLQNNRTLFSANFIVFGDITNEYVGKMVHILGVNTTLRSLFYNNQVDDDVKRLLDRNISGWSPEIHYLFPRKLRERIEFLLKAQFLQVRYPNYNQLPREILYPIFRYLC